MRPPRRRCLAGAGALLGLGAGAGALTLPGVRAAGDPDDPRFLIVFSLFGGASMIDCFAAIDASEARTDPNRGTVISFDTLRPPGSPFRCPNREVPVGFLLNHAQEMAVVGINVTALSHFTAQERAMTGNGALGGRTLAEAVAAVYGQGYPLPNVNMGRGGFAKPGHDRTLDPAYVATAVANPPDFALGTDGVAGVLPLDELPGGDLERTRRLVQAARDIRDGTLEAASPFGRTFAASARRRDLLLNRLGGSLAMEQSGLIEKLMFLPADAGLPLVDYGLATSPMAERVLELLPDAVSSELGGAPADALHAQAALAYLLIQSGSSVAVTISEYGATVSPGFDSSHSDHDAAHVEHWDRTLQVADALITLLKETEYVDRTGKATGTSLWDRSFILFHTEFGRDKWNTGERFGTGHHLNNAILMASPLLKGGTMLGEPDPNNGYITGYDLETGEPTPYTRFDELGDPVADSTEFPPGEGTVYGAVLDLLGISYDGQQTIPALRPA